MTLLAELRVPATTASLRTIRLLVGGLAAAAELSVDAVEDLQMGSAECSALILGGAGADDRLLVEVHDTDGVVEVRGVVEADLPEVEIDELATLVLAGTVDEHELHGGPGRRSFLVRKRRD